jgi:hypothetical protein
MSSGVRGASRTGPLFWILTGGAVFLVLLFGGLFLIGWQRSKSLHFEDPMSVIRDQIHRTYPNSEIIEEDPASMRIRFRDKSTGKESIYLIEPDTKQFHMIEPGSGPQVPVK